jgi:hemoglobin-like flavoprotein
MNDNHAKVFQDSVSRCLESTSFIQDFYDRFIGHSDAIRDKFKNTDLQRQAQAMADSLYSIAVAVQGGPENLARADMKRLHVKHRTMGIERSMYDTWLECFVETARTHDPEFSSSVEKAWRACLAAGIEAVTKGTPYKA